MTSQASPSHSSEPARDLPVDLNAPVGILVVDDRPADLKALLNILSAPEYDIIAVSSGTEVLRQLLERDFAVVLLDVLMPGMDGFELASLIRRRERSRHTPIIFLTAAAPDISKVYRGYSVGAVDYLSKPVDPDVVRAKVSIFAELFRKDRQLKAQALALKEGERRKRELEVAELKLLAQRRYKNLAEAVPHMVWTASPDGHLDYANQRWIDYTGLGLDAAHGLGWLSALHRDDRGDCERAWQQAVGNREAFEFECRVRRAVDGAHRWHLCRAVPETDDAGNVVAWLGTYTDFEALKQAIAARDEFLSIASHELRTPLTALKLRLQSVQAVEDLDPKLRHRIDAAERQSERLEQLIAELLDVSRVSTGHFDLELEPCDLCIIVRETLEAAVEQTGSSASLIELDLPDKLLGNWDGLRLEQMATNLLSNALDYGGGKPIRVRAWTDSGDVHLSVTDLGAGIEPKDVERIFERFERGGPRRTQGGLGLGLYLVKTIVDAHSGSIEVKSRAGIGTTFHVVLPVRELPEPRRASESPDADAVPRAALRGASSAARTAASSSTNR